MARQGSGLPYSCAQQTEWSGQVILSGPQMCTTPRDHEGLGPPSMGHDSCSAGRRPLLHLWNFSLYPGHQHIYNPQTPMTPPPPPL